MHMKQWKCTQDGQAVSDIHRRLLGPDHVTRHAMEVERKLQNSHYEGWVWQKYVAFHKEQHTIVESLAGHGYSHIDNGTKVHYIFQGIRSTEIKTVVNVSWAK